MGEISKQILPLFSYALHHNLCCENQYNELFVSLVLTVLTVIHNGKA